MSIVRGTTPTFLLEFPNDIDLTEAANVYVTFGKNGTVITKATADLDIEPHSISVHLTQEETLKFGIGALEIQANWVFANGRRVASEISTYVVTKQLLAEVIS
jgi:hypothetical protein